MIQTTYSRWAIKQERITSLEGKGEWIKSQVGNPEWNKRALSWPLTEEGKLNDVSGIDIQYLQFAIIQSDKLSET